MTDERKLEVFEDLVQWIYETAESGGYNGDVKELFLDLGFTEKEYEAEI